MPGRVLFPFRGYTSRPTEREGERGPPIIKLAGVMQGSFNEGRKISVLKQATAALIPISLQKVGIATVSPAYLLHEIPFSEKVRADNPIRPPAAAK